MTEERRRIEEMRNELEQEKERHEREVSELEEARRDWEIATRSLKQKRKTTLKSGFEVAPGGLNSLV